jgi:hypothetical protein
MTPYTLEMILFLKFNRKYWDAFDFANAMVRSSNKANPRETRDELEHEAELQFGRGESVVEDL